MQLGCTAQLPQAAAALSSRGRACRANGSSLAAKAALQVADDFVVVRLHCLDDAGHRAAHPLCLQVLQQHSLQGQWQQEGLSSCGLATEQCPEGTGCLDVMTS